MLKTDNSQNVGGIMDQTFCISCGKSIGGKYCGNCGEKVVEPKQRTLKYFIDEFSSQFIFYESKTLKTLRTLFLKPGQLSADFVIGRRVLYMKPLSLFLLANLIYFLFPLTQSFNTDLQVQMQGMFYREMVVRWVDSALIQEGLTLEQYRLVYDSKTAELAKILLIVMVLMLSFVMLLINQGSKNSHYSDQLVVSFEVMTFFILVFVQMFGLIIKILHSLDIHLVNANHLELFYSAIIFLFLLVYFYKVERRFYQFGPVRACINGLLCAISYFLVMFLYRMILFFVTYWSV